MRIKLFLLIFLVVSCQPVKRDNNRRAEFQIEFIAQESGVDASMRGICAVSQDIAWVSGSNSTVLKTMDGGDTWNKLNVDILENVDFRDIQAFNDSIALVLIAGQPAKILKTSDGGTSWSQVFSTDAEGAFFDAFDFWDRNNGIAISDPVNEKFLVIRTTDGGDSWIDISENLPDPLKNEYYFAASGTCLRVKLPSQVWFVTGGAVSRLFYSEDMGDTWHVNSIPFNDSSSASGIFSMAVKDQKNLFLVGGDYTKPSEQNRTSFNTTDGGKIWQVPDSLPLGYRSCISYIVCDNQELLIATGTNGTDISYNLGTSWQKLDTLGYHAIGVVQGSNTGWMTGAKGDIRKFIFRLDY